MDFRYTHIAVIIAAGEGGGDLGGVIKSNLFSGFKDKCSFLGDLAIHGEAVIVLIAAIN